MEQPAVTEKLAPAGPLLPGSGRLSPDTLKLPASVESPGCPLDSVPPMDRAEMLQDSFIKLQAGAELTSEAQDEEDGADPTHFDISLEGGARVPMDRSVIEQLRNTAAAEVAVWDQCLDRMTLNEHPRCEFPHVYGIQNNMEYYRKMELPDRKLLYDEFHDAVLRNDLTEDDIHQTDPFTLRYVLARLIRAEDPLPEELLPAMEARLKWHHVQISNRRADKIRSIQELNSRLEELLKSEAVPDVAEGMVVPSHQESDSSFQSAESERPDTSIQTVVNMETEEAPQVETEDPSVGSVKLEDQLLLPLADHSAPDCADYPWEHPRF